MQRIQRRVGRLPFMPGRTPNEADIEAMLRDFNDSDQMLERVCVSRSRVNDLSPAARNANLNWPGGSSCCRGVPCGITMPSKRPQRIRKPHHTPARTQPWPHTLSSPLHPTRPSSLTFTDRIGRKAMARRVDKHPQSPARLHRAHAEHIQTIGRKGRRIRFSRTYRHAIRDHGALCQVGRRFLGAQDGYE